MQKHFIQNTYQFIQNADHLNYYLVQCFSTGVQRNDMISYRVENFQTEDAWSLKTITFSRVVPKRNIGCVKGSTSIERLSNTDLLEDCTYLEFQVEFKTINYPVLVCPV
jgi:hypothetical protein